MKSDSGRRYDAEFMLECVLLRIKSPSTYKHLRKSGLLPLPSRTSLHNLIGGMSVHFGFNEFSPYYWVAGLLHRYTSPYEVPQKLYGTVPSRSSMYKFISLSNKKITHNSIKIRIRTFLYLEQSLILSSSWRQIIWQIFYQYLT